MWLYVARRGVARVVEVWVNGGLPRWEGKKRKVWPNGQKREWLGVVVRGGRGVGEGL